MRSLGLAAAALFAAPVLAQPATFTIDPTHTSVVFEADANGLSTLRGRVAKQQGTITLDRAARAGRAEIDLDMTSTSTGIAALDAGLPGLLDSAAHPTARFVGERFVFDGERVTAVEGTLAFRGRDKRVALKASNFNCYNNPLLRREVCGGDFETTLTRADLGLGPALPVLGETFRLLVQVEAIRQP